MSSPSRTIPPGIRGVIVLLLVGVTGALLWYAPRLSASSQQQGAGPLPASTRPASPTKSLPPPLTLSRGPYRTQGKQILDARGQAYLFHGIARDGLEYTCLGDPHLNARELGYLGPGTNTSTATYWGANTVRLPLSEGFWLYGDAAHQCSAQGYQRLVRQVVNILGQLGLNTILDLQWNDAGGQSDAGGGQWPLPDRDSLSFWRQVAGDFKENPNVLFELFNEPHPASWSCWQQGCVTYDYRRFSDDCQCLKTLSYLGLGMQALIDGIRGTGSTNLILVGGIDWGYDLSQIAQYPLKGSNLVYATHPYPYLTKQAHTWDASFGLISQRYPVLSTESGEYDCQTTYLAPLIAYFESHHIGWVAWSWNTTGNICTYPRLVLDYTGKPTAMGHFIYQRLRSYLPPSKSKAP